MPFGNERGYKSKYPKVEAHYQIIVPISTTAKQNRINYDFNIPFYKICCGSDSLHPSNLPNTVYQSNFNILNKKRIRKSKDLPYSKEPPSTDVLLSLLKNIWILILMCSLLNLSESRRSPRCFHSSCDNILNENVTETIPDKVTPYKLNLNRSESCTNIKGWWFCDVQQQPSRVHRNNKKDRKRKRFNARFRNHNNEGTSLQNDRGEGRTLNLPTNFVFVKDTFSNTNNVMANDTLLNFYFNGRNDTGNSANAPGYIVRARVEEENISYHRLKAEVTLLELASNSVAINKAQNVPNKSGGFQTNTHFSTSTNTNLASLNREKSSIYSLDELVNKTQLIITAKIEPINRRSSYALEQSQPYVSHYPSSSTTTAFDPIISKLKRWAKNDRDLLGRLDKYREAGAEAYYPFSGHHHSENYNYNYSRLDHYGTHSLNGNNLSLNFPWDKYRRLGGKPTKSALNVGTESWSYRESPILPLKIIPLKILKGPKGIGKQIVGKPIFVTWKMDWQLNNGQSQPSNADTANTNINTNFFKFQQETNFNINLPQTPDDSVNNGFNRQDKFILFLEPYRKFGIRPNNRGPQETPLSLFYLHSVPFVSTPKIRRQIRKIHIKTSELCVNPRSRNSIRISNINPKSMRVLFDKTIVLSCQITNRKAAAKLKWYKDGQRLQPSRLDTYSQKIIINQTKNVSTLRIYRVKLKNSGIYQCRTRTFCGHNIASPNTTVEIYRKVNYKISPYDGTLHDSKTIGDHDKITGAHIGKHIDPSCQYNICTNGGTCMINKSGKHYCQCTEEYFGNLCQYET